MAHRADLDKILQPAVQAAGSDLLGCEFISQGRHSVLRVYIDRPTGVTVEDCEAVSNQVSTVLDVEDLIKGDYTLEVASPGLDRPLFNAEQFLRAQHQEVKVLLNQAVDGQRKFTGVIENVSEGIVILNDGNKTHHLPLTNISKANVVAKI
jgi:ribosome maturation factor RimP